MVRAYLELLDTWDPDRREHLISVYLTTRSDPGESALHLDHQPSHQFVIRKPNNSPSSFKENAQFGARGNFLCTFEQTNTIMEATTSLNTNTDVSIEGRIDKLSESLLQAIYIHNQPFVPSDESPSIHVKKKIGQSLFEALCRPGSLAANLFSEYPHPKNLSFTLVTTSPLLNAIGWEFAYRKYKENGYNTGYFVVQRHVFSRGLVPKDQLPPSSNGCPMNILVIPSKPLNENDNITVHQEWRALSDLFASLDCSLTVRRVVPPTFNMTDDRLERDEPNIVLFSGHGVFSYGGDDRPEYLNIILAVPNSHSKRITVIPTRNSPMKF